VGRGRHLWDQGYSEKALGGPFKAWGQKEDASLEGEQTMVLRVTHQKSEKKTNHPRGVAMSEALHQRTPHQAAEKAGLRRGKSKSMSVTGA